jgi:hypothetical protein
LKTKIGFKTSDPDWREPNSIKSYYDGIVVDKRGYYYAKAATNVWKNDKKWKRLPLPITEIEWSETYYPNEANALYTRLGNDVCTQTNRLLSYVLTIYFRFT